MIQSTEYKPAATIIREGLAKMARNDALAEEIATLSAQIQAANYRLLELIREFDEAGGWAQQGAISCAQWLSWRIGLAPVAARERLRVAHALASLPHVSEAMRRARSPIRRSARSREPRRPTMKTSS